MSFDGRDELSGASDKYSPNGRAPRTFRGFSESLHINRLQCTRVLRLEGAHQAFNTTADFSCDLRFRRGVRLELGRERVERPAARRSPSVPIDCAFLSVHGTTARCPHRRVGPCAPISRRGELDVEKAL